MQFCLIFLLFGRCNNFYNLINKTPPTKSNLICGVYILLFSFYVYKNNQILAIFRMLYLINNTIEVFSK